MKHRTLFLILSLILGLSPAFASAATTKFEVSGWLPYWRSASSTKDVLPHLDEVTEVNPFVYTLKSDGTLLDNGKLDQEPWLSFIASAKMQHVRVIPTVMTGNGDLLHGILSNAKKRQALETLLAKTVKQNGFDGIDIDFEGKKAADKNYFSTFLKGLYSRMGSKWVMCTIESRTPLDSRYYGSDVPPDAEVYANDLKAINKYCDRVRIMTYDQQTIDQSLAAAYASSSQLYAPVSDPAWVEKVVDLMSKTISKKKLEIGIPTYGYEYDVTAYNDGTYAYDILWTFNPLYALQAAAQFGVSPARAPWGEMELTHIKDTNSTGVAPMASGNYTGLAAAAAASTYAQATNGHTDFRLLVWPDAQAIANKVAMAKALGVRGVSIFKFDGGEDPDMWNVLQGAKQ
jgi:spore germination protein YaaH